MPGAARPPERAADRPLESRLKWLMFGRLAIAVVGIFVTLLLQPAGGGTLAPNYMLLAACLLNLVYLFAARAGAPLRPLAVIQLVLDVCLIGALTYLTGIDRFFAFLFFATVIAAAMLAGLRMAIAMASSASIVLAAVSTLYFLATSSETGLRLPFVDAGTVEAYASRRGFVLPYLFFFALSLHVVALLAGRLTAEVRRVRILNDEILQNMAGGVLAADKFGEIQFINAQAAKLLGIGDPEAARGTQFDRALPPKVAELLHRATRSEGRVADELQINGSPVRVAVSCLAEGGGPLRGVVAMLTDLSLRTQMEEMTRRAERFKALLEMSAAMAHEIRNPLASIRGAAQELETSKLPREDDRQLLAVVVRESDRLDQIISEFLDYASDRPIDMGLFDLSEVLRETALLLQARRDPRVKIERQVPPKMLCRGSPDKLKQVFLNLGLNATDACTQDGRAGGVLTIRSSPARGSESDPREGVRVEFADNGCGISRENLGRVFDPFFTTKPHGVGMGLAIARKIVQAHGGEITMDSVEGKGATVRVWLPL